MTTWHSVRRVLAALIAASVAAGAQRYDIPPIQSVLLGIACAIVFGGLLFPLVWKPPSLGPPQD